MLPAILSDWIPALLLVAALAPTAPVAHPWAHQDDEMGWTGVLDEESFAALHELKEGEAPELRGEDVEIGETSAYLSEPPEGEPIGAVLVIHEWWGLNDHVKHWADRLASDGYTALAVDLYGGEVATTREEAMSLMRGVDEAAALATLRAAHEYLVDDVGAERTACVGWCFGGGWSLRLAMGEPELDAAVIYYGRLVTDPERLAEIEAPMLGIFGNDDSGIPPEAVEEFADAMEEAGNDLELRQYDADHAFANPSSARYDAENAAAAWREVRAFLCEHLWPPQPGGSFSDGSRELDFEAPSGWTEDGPKTMRIESFSIGTGTQCYVAALRGDGGGVAANLNRWRAQVGEGPLDEDELEALPHVPMLGRLAVTLRAEGDFEDRGSTISDAAVLGAICVLDDEALFVKMIGPRDEVDQEAARFAAFCRNLR